MPQIHDCVASIAHSCIKVNDLNAAASLTDGVTDHFRAKSLFPPVFDSSRMSAITMSFWIALHIS